ncbi:hypothetical protein AB5I41_28970 [Sphingomonas sp. MMS24-JH45]
MDNLLAQISAAIIAHDTEARKAASALHRVLNERLGMKIGFSLPGRDENGVPNISA